MAKEIKFKAKTLNDDVVIGSGVFTLQGMTSIIVDDEMIRCHIDSVREFTGIRDKNDEMIFDGDSLLDTELGGVYEVEYNTQNTKYELKLRNIDDIKTIDDILFVTFSVETVGNGYYSRKDLELIKD